MEGGSNGHHSYETDFSVRYLAGTAVVVHVAAVHLLFVIVLVFVDLAVLALGGPLAAALRSVRRRTIGLGAPAGVANSDGHVSHSCGRCCTRGCSRLTAPLHAFCCVTCRDSEGEQHTPDCYAAVEVATSPAPPPPGDEDDMFIDDGDDDDEPSAAPPPHVALPPQDDVGDMFIDNGDDDDDESSAAAPPAPPDQQEQSDSDVEVTGVIGGDLDATVPTPAVLALDQAVLEGGESPAGSTESESFSEASHSAEPTAAPKRLVSDPAVRAAVESCSFPRSIDL